MLALYNYVIHVRTYNNTNSFYWASGDQPIATNSGYYVFHPPVMNSGTSIDLWNAISILQVLSWLMISIVCKIFKHCSNSCSSLHTRIIFHDMHTAVLVKAFWDNFKSIYYIPSLLSTVHVSKNHKLHYAISTNFCVPLKIVCTQSLLQYTVIKMLKLWCNKNITESK